MRLCTVRILMSVEALKQQPWQHGNSFVLFGAFVLPQRYTLYVQNLHICILNNFAPKLGAFK